MGCGKQQQQGIGAYMRFLLRQAPHAVTVADPDRIKQCSVCVSSWENSNASYASIHLIDGDVMANTEQDNSRASAPSGIIPEERRLL